MNNNIVKLTNDELIKINNRINETKVKVKNINTHTRTLFGSIEQHTEHIVEALNLIIDASKRHVPFASIWTALNKLDEYILLVKSSTEI